MRNLIVVAAAVILNFAIFTLVAAAPFDTPSTPAPPVTATSATSTLLATSPIISEVAAAPSTATSVLSVPSKSVNTDYSPIVTLLPSVEHTGWKTTEHFEFTRFDGLLESYNANEPVEFTVAGTSSSLAIERTNGFNVVVTMFDTTRKIGKRAAIAYDPIKNAWLVRLSAPANNSTVYKLIVNLFCEKKESPCSDTFGFGTQIDKSITLQVR